MGGGKEPSDFDRLNKPPPAAAAPSTSSDPNDNDCGLPITCFSEVLNDVSLHFQIIRFPNQIYAWVGCNSTKFGQLYAAATTRPNNAVSVASILGGTSDNTGSGIARRLVLKTGLNIVFASNIPKNNAKLEDLRHYQFYQNQSVMVEGADSGLIVHGTLQAPMAFYFNVARKPPSRDKCCHLAS